MNATKINSFASYFGVEFDSTPWNYGSSDTDWQLVDMIGVEYDPARGASEEDIQKWNEFLHQMTQDDVKLLFSKGLRKTMAVDSIGKPGTNDQNASNGFEWAFGYQNSSDSKYNPDAGFMHAFDPDSAKAYSTGYPCEGIRAAMFNDEMAYLVGQAMGEDALWTGASGLYGFGLGMQRNPYHGRAGEFYSDDSYLTGRTGGYETKGAQSKGLYVYNKHFVLNDQDTKRTSYKAWLNEQTMRQIYLRPFEMAVEIGDAMNVMISFNKIGNAWGGSSYNLMERWLHGEAGMAGFAISDYSRAAAENLGYGILAGSSLLDGDNSSGLSVGSDARYDNRVMDAAKRILYTVANSNAMNMIGDTAETYSYDPLWYQVRDGVVPPAKTAVEVLFWISLAFVVGTTTWKLVDKYVFKKDE